MTPLNAIPIDSISWLIGSAAVLILGGRSFLSYRHSRDELSKYMAWFALVMSAALAALSVPSFFTLDIGTLCAWVLVGEGFFYVSMIAQAAMMWFLFLRPRFPAWFVTVPVGIMGLLSWMYSLPGTYVLLTHNFMAFFNPRISTIVMAVLLIGLLGPVGLYFLRSAPRQTGFKAIFTSVALGLAYLGSGLTGGGFEIVTGQVMTPTSIIGFTIFFSVLLIAMIWPRRASAKPPMQLPTASS
jgi:hypothetical protein